jgi:hypothetical protein
MSLDSQAQPGFSGVAVPRTLQPVNYSDRKCCAMRKVEMWRFLIILDFLYTGKPVSRVPGLRTRP